MSGTTGGELPKASPTGSEPRLLRGLRPESKRHVLQSAENCRFAPNEDLNEEPGTVVGLVLAGLIRVYLPGDEQREYTVRYLRPGDFLGADRLLGLPVTVRARALTPVRFLRLRGATVAKLMRTEPDLTLAVALELATDHRATLEQFEQAAFRHLRSRLANQLRLRVSAYDLTCRCAYDLTCRSVA
jgi:CRP-like cAMP-binding protein